MHREGPGDEAIVLICLLTQIKFSGSTKVAVTSRWLVRNYLGHAIYDGIPSFEEVCA